MGVYVGDNLVAGNVGEVYSKAQVDAMIANAVALAEPTGSIKPFAGTTVPDGYLLCDGSAVSRTTYAALFAVIGTTYGTGDGSTTFNLPNYSDCFLQGGTPGLAHAAGLPNITGKFAADAGQGGFDASGAFYTITGTNTGRSWDVNANTNYAMDASRSSPIYGASTTVQPKSVESRYVIKY